MLLFILVYWVFCTSLPPVRKWAPRASNLLDTHFCATWPVNTMTILPLPGPATFVILSALALSGCRLPTTANDADVIANLRFSPGAFDSFRRNTEILYTLNQPVRVTFSIVRRPGRTSRS